MKKKLMIVLLSFVCILCLALGLTACGEVSSGSISDSEQNSEQSEDKNDDNTEDNNDNENLDESNTDEHAHIKATRTENEVDATCTKMVRMMK